MKERERQPSPAHPKVGYVGVYPLLIGILGLGLSWAGWLAFNAINPPSYGEMGPGQSLMAYLTLGLAVGVFALTALAGLLLVIFRFIRG